MKKNPSLTIIIPCYNEEESLKVLLPELLEFAGTKDYSVIAVNDGSTDETGKILEQYSSRDGFSFFNHKVNRGYGGAIKTGILNANTDCVITVDADRQHYKEDIKLLFEFLKDKNADMVVGSRGSSKSASVYRGIGKWLIRKLSHILTNHNIHDLNSGMKIYDTQTAKKYIHLYPDTMAFSDIITLVFISQKHLVLEHPINTRDRVTGKSTVGLGSAVDTVKELFNIVMLFNPMKIFLPVSVLLVAAGVVWGIPFLLAGKGVSVGAALLILSGIITFLLGLLAEQVSILRKRN